MHVISTSFASPADAGIDECCAACATNPQCGAYVYRKGNPPFATPSCILFRALRECHPGACALGPGPAQDPLAVKYVAVGSEGVASHIASSSTCKVGITAVSLLCGAVRCCVGDGLTVDTINLYVSLVIFRASVTRLGRVIFIATECNLPLSLHIKEVQVIAEGLCDSCRLHRWRSRTSGQSA